MKWKYKRLWDWTIYFTILTGWLSGCWLSKDCWAWSGLWWDFFLMKTSKWHSSNNFFDSGTRNECFHSTYVQSLHLESLCPVSFKTWMMWPWCQSIPTQLVGASENRKKAQLGQSSHSYFSAISGQKFDLTTVLRSCWPIEWHRRGFIASSPFFSLFLTFAHEKNHFPVVKSGFWGHISH